MSVGIRIFLWVTIIWVAPLIYAQLKNDAVFKKNLAVGTTLPQEARSDEEVGAVLEKYKKQELWIMWGMLALAAVFFFAFRSSKSMMNSYGLWLDLCIAVPMVPYALANRELRRIKAERGWVKESRGKILVDTRVIPEQKWISPWIFALCTAVCMLPLIWERSGLLFYVTYALSDVCFWLCYRFCLRSRADIVDDNSELTAALTRIRRSNWGRMWVFIAAGTAAMSVLHSFVISSIFGTLALMLVWTAVIVSGMIKVEFRVRRLQEKLTEDCGAKDYSDEDDNWLFGIVYFNPSDRHFIVNNRTSIGTNMNLARPAGKVVAIFLVLILVWMPFMGSSMSLIGRGPIAVECTEESFAVSYGSREYMKIKTEDIQKAELLWELPENLSRIWGTGAEMLLKGSFSSELGDLDLCLDPECPPYILITRNSGSLSLAGTRTKEETLAAFEALQKLLK